MVDMETVNQALDRLAGAGFGADLVADGDRLRVAGSGRTYDPAELAVIETDRFEGTSDPGDEAVVFALATVAGDPVGTFTMPYGPAAGRDEETVARRLSRSSAR